MTPELAQRCVEAGFLWVVFLLLLNHVAQKYRLKPHIIVEQLWVVSLTLALLALIGGLIATNGF